MIRKKEKIHCPLTDEMLSDVKLSNDFYATKEKRTLYAGWCMAFSKAEEIK